MEALETIKVTYCGKTEIFTLKGKGAYPYDCIAKDKHPDALIYVTEGGSGWLASYELREIAPGHYGINGWSTMIKVEFTLTVNGETETVWREIDVLDDRDTVALNILSNREGGERIDYIGNSGGKAAIYPTRKDINNDSV